MPLNRPRDRAPRPAWRLRGVLGLLLAGLVAAAIGASTASPPSRVVAAPAVPLAPPPPSVAVPTTAGRATSASSPPATTPAPSVRPPHWTGSGCALTLASRRAGAVGHCTVLEIGDSLGNDLGWGLLRELSPASGLDLVQADVSSTGLVNRAFYDWPAQLAADLRRDRPQLVLVSLGGNDEQGMIVGGRAVPFASPAWDRAYSAEVSALVQEATSAGAYVAWVGLPIMEQPGFSSGAAVLDELYQRAVAADPYAVYVSVWKLFSDPSGGYAPTAEVNGAPTPVREPDGVHYSLAGENVLATDVIRRLAEAFHVRLAPQEPANLTGW